MKYQNYPHDPTSHLLTIAQVKKAIDHAQQEVEVEFIGQVIGFDSLRYAHVSDETGTIYVRAHHSSLVKNQTVRIKGWGFVYLGSDNYPEYTRQIKAEGLVVEFLEDEVKPKAVKELNSSDLMVNYATDYQHADFHGNVIKVTGIVQTGKSKFDFYLVNDEDERFINIHHYSSNFQNQTLNKNKNLFLELNHKRITITGIIYRFFIKEQIWTIQCIGLPNELEVIKENGEISGYVNLFTINDTHGVFFTEGEYPGLEKVQTVIRELESENGGYIKIANGDIFQGSYVSNINFGRPLIDCLNKMRFDCMTIGNHEFDWGIDLIKSYCTSDKQAEFPFLAANIVSTLTGEKLDWTKDYVIVQNNGYKVGIIGTIGFGLESSIASSMVMGYSFLDPVEIVSELALTLRMKHACDLVIVAIHGYSPTANASFASLSDLNRIDAIICAHSHQQIADYELRADGYLVPIIQCNAKNVTVGELRIALNSEKMPLEAKIRHYHPILYGEDDSIVEVISSYNEDIESGNTEISYTVEHLDRQRLGMEMIKAIKFKFQTDYAIINTGGVRAEVAVGIIAIKHIYDVFPFDNKVVLTNMTGHDLIKLYHNNGSHLFFNDEFDIEAINITETYSIATIDYVFTNPNYIEDFENCVMEETSFLMRDVLIEYLKN